MKNKLLKTVIMGVVVMACSWPQFTLAGDSSSVCVDPLIMQLDSMSGNLLTRDKYFASDDQVLKSIYMPTDMIPHYTDAEIQEKMKLMPNVIPMVFNSQVKQFIELFAYKRRALMTRCLANSQLYFPIFERILDRKGLPIELKYLPVVESAFNPIAVSGAGATGLWQLMYGTGTLMGLDVNSYIDERRDPVKATEAATDYLQKLYAMYGDWHLVLAAYNSGPGNVNKAIARAGGVKDFWAIMPYLPAETRSYVPLYIAASYVLNYHKDFDLYSAEPRINLYAIDTVLITSKVSLNHISNVLGIAEDELQFLNPSIKRGVIPYTKDGFPLNLPINYFALFEAKKADVMLDTTQIVKEMSPVVAVSTEIHHKVRRGETLGEIADKYNVSLSALRSMNHMHHSSLLRVGQVLRVRSTKREQPTAPGYTQVFAPRSFDKAQLDSIENTSSKTNNQMQNQSDSDIAVADSSAGNETGENLSIDVKNEKCGCIYHVVQDGDTLWNIAQKYDGVTVDQLKADNRSLNARQLKVGDVLKIFLNN